MRALVFDKSKTDWESSRGFDLVDIPKPVLDKTNSAEDNHVILKVRYAGICGTDRGIWNRVAFRDAILNTIDKQIENGGNSYRIIGHEFFGEIMDVGSKVENVKVGDLVSSESHLFCQKCYQCARGQREVCTNETILGIHQDGGLAEFIKLPDHVLRKTDTSKIRPEIAAMQEPFGNAVHAGSKVDVKDKTVAIFGLGPIGLFLTLVMKGLGAKTIIGVEPNLTAIEMAKKLGIDHVIPLGKSDNAKPYAHDMAVAEEIKKLTDDVGVDVSFEMSGFNSSANNCLYATRRGGDIILFGIKQGDFVFEDYNRMIFNGFTLHLVIGRQLWRTWDITKQLFEDQTNGIQEKLFDVILNGGQGTILPIAEYSKEKFEEMMTKHPKLLIKF